MQVGRYEILEPLGAGSMGTVNRALDTVLNRFVALKTIRCGADLEPEIRERFYREAWACARLQHPAIITVYDLGESDQLAYIAMELLTGADFRKLIDRRAEIPLSDKLRAMAQICEGLAHAHRNGILHRDIKPSNLFLVDGKDARILDFGMARMPGSILTVAERPLGTPNYMAPEQILGFTTDERADLFSTAVVFFEFLVYTHPFQNDVIPKRIVDTEPASLFDYDSSLPGSLEKILAKGLSKRPADRFQTGDEFANALRAIVAGLPSEVELPLVRSIPAAGAGPAADRKACRYCGASNRAVAMYCIHCGGRLSTPAPALPEPVPPTAPPPLITANLPLLATQIGKLPSAPAPTSGGFPKPVPTFSTPPQPLEPSAPRRRSARSRWVLLAGVLLGIAAVLLAAWKLLSGSRQI